MLTPASCSPASLAMRVTQRRAPWQVRGLLWVSGRGNGVGLSEGFLESEEIEQLLAQGQTAWEVRAGGG